MAFNVTLDFFGALEKWIQFRKINEWVKLGIELHCSFWLSGCFAAGGFLIAHRPPWEALGEGLVVAVIFAVKIWRKSPLTKGLILALPAEEAGEELGVNEQVISK